MLYPLSYGTSGVRLAQADDVAMHDALMRREVWHMGRECALSLDACAVATDPSDIQCVATSASRLVRPRADTAELEVVSIGLLDCRSELGFFHDVRQTVAFRVGDGVVFGGEGKLHL
jgi:hypothetical protein